MKFREQTAKKKSIRQIAGMFLAVTVLLAGSPYIAEAAEIVKDMDGTAYAQDAAGFVYQIPKGATTKKGCSIYMYTGEKSTVTFPAKCNSYVVTNIGTNLGQLILTNLQTVKIPSGYTTIETQAFQNQTDLYQIEIPASVKTIGIDAFAGCNKARLTIVTPYGSAAETYAKANEIHYSSQTSLQIQAGYSKLYVGESRSIVVLNASVAPVWKSSNSSVVSVDADGRLTAKKAGTVKITATIGKKTYTYPYTVIARSQKNVLDIIWNQYVTSGMSDYEKAVAAQQWMQQNVSPNGTSVLAQKALEQGKANYKGFCEAYQLIMKHYGISAKVVNGKKHMENSVVIAGKKYTASTLETSANADKTYTTTTIPGLAVNRVTMVLSKGRTGTFKVTGPKQRNYLVQQQHEGCGSKCQWQSDGKGYRHSQSNIESKRENICLHRLRKSMKRLKGEIERMKKVMKRVITACLAFAMILALVTPASVEAATKNESLTLYKGETYTWYLTGVKSFKQCVKHQESSCNSKSQ